mmetsp:Transcript_13439/g.38159  ORF Transcript_13439/g.38159 Transcript_13439/m.38159 type:complete len:92 (-) Transcript_13439:99-374(-)
MPPDHGIIPTDNGMEDLIEQHGREVAESLRKVVLELHEFNPSGRYVVYKPWLRKQDKAASPADVMRQMSMRGRMLTEKCQAPSSRTRSRTH